MCYSKVNIRTPKGNINVPCGKCPQCLEVRRAEWTFRILEEEKTCKSSHFVTLTYNDENLPRSRDGTPTIDKSDHQNFVKILRKKTKEKIKYFAVSEYGSQFDRPHFHSIMFNANQDIIHESWKKGFVNIGEVTQASIHYVTGYVIQASQLKGQKETIPGAMVSNRPAIGYGYIKRIGDFHNRTDSLQVTYPGGQTQKLPRYYSTKLYSDIHKKVLFKMQYDEFLKEWQQKTTEEQTDYFRQEIEEIKLKQYLMIKHSKSKL